MDHSCFNFYFCVETDLRTDKTQPLGLECVSNGRSYLKNTNENEFEVLAAAPKCYVDIYRSQHLDLCECCGGTSQTPQEEEPSPYNPGTPGDADDPFVSWLNIDQKYALPLNSQDLVKLKNNETILQITKIQI